MRNSSDLLNAWFHKGIVAATMKASREEAWVKHTYRERRRGGSRWVGVGKKEKVGQGEVNEGIERGSVGKAYLKGEKKGGKDKSIMKRGREKQAGCGGDMKASREEGGGGVGKYAYHHGPRTRARPRVRPKASAGIRDSDSTRTRARGLQQTFGP